MQDKLVSFKTAKLAREKGFDIHCDYRYVEKKSQKQHDKNLINWKDYSVNECINYNRDYAYKAVEHLSYRYNEIFNNNDKDYYLSAPTQSLLQKWLREKHKIHIKIGMHEFNKWVFGIQYIDEPIKDYSRIAKSGDWNIEDYFSYEEALEEGLYEALKLIKNENDRKRNT